MSTVDVNQLVTNIISSSELRARLTALFELGLHQSPLRAYKTAGRLLQPEENDNADTATDNTKIESFFPIKKKYKVQYQPGALVLVTDYSDKSHAIFGDFESSLVKSFKDEMERTTWIAPKNASLAFGEGYIIKFKDKLSVLESMITKHHVEYRKISKQRFELECKGELNTHEHANSPTLDSKSIVPPTPTSSPRRETSSEPIVSAMTPPGTPHRDEFEVPTLKENKWKNMWHEETKLVFQQKSGATASSNGEWICIGMQDKKCRHRGPEGVLPLTSNEQKICQSKKWKY